MKVVLIGIATGLLLSVLRFVWARIGTSDATGPKKQELTGVRVRADHEVLERVRAAAAAVRWTEVRYDDKGRFTLVPPANYSPDDFGRLLGAIDPIKGEIDGMQLLGPHGGSVDDKGIEHQE